MPEKNTSKPGEFFFLPPLKMTLSVTEPGPREDNSAKPADAGQAVNKENVEKLIEMLSQKDK